MWTYLTVGLGLFVNFVIPAKPKRLDFDEKKENHSIISDKNEIHYSNIGYPFTYFEGDFLSDEEIRFRLRFMKVCFVTTVGHFGALPSPAYGVGLFPPSRGSISSLAIPRNEADSQFKEVNWVNNVKKDKISIRLSQKEMIQIRQMFLESTNCEMGKNQLWLEDWRGGSLTTQDWVARVGFGILIFTALKNLDSYGFQATPPQAQRFPPILDVLLGDNKPPHAQGYGKNSGPSNIKTNAATRNAGSKREDSSPSRWDYNYEKLIRELEELSNKRKFEIQVGDEMYTIQNPYKEEADELQFKLGEKIYDSIRESDTDICDIAQNLGFKADNIKNVKDHVFYSEHDLDRYGPDDIEHKRFDATLEQALAWKRLENGVHTQEDITWIKHECAERHHELKYGSGYSEAHERAQSRYDGYPWEENDF